MSTETLEHTTIDESFTLSNSDVVLSQTLDDAEMISQGVTGPAGPAGATGPAGTSESIWYHPTIDITEDTPAPVFTLVPIPMSTSVSMYLNGLRETGNNYTVVGGEVTVTGFGLYIGDTVEFTYQ